MRAAIVIPRAWDAAAFSGDPRILAGGFNELGHEAVIVCCSGSAYPPGVAAVTVPFEVMGSADWWRRERFDLAIVFTWLHSYSNVVSGIAKGGTFVISKGDSDGVHGARAHPLKTLRRAVESSDDPVVVARNGWLWLKRLVLEHEHTNHAIPFLDNFRKANVTVVETEIARGHLVRFLESVGASTLPRSFGSCRTPLPPRLSRSPWMSRTRESSMQ